MCPHHVICSQDGDKVRWCYQPPIGGRIASNVVVQVGWHHVLSLYWFLSIMDLPICAYIYIIFFFLIFKIFKVIKLSYG
jgi:hypothetical protein